MQDESILMVSTKFRAVRKDENDFKRSLMLQCEFFMEIFEKQELRTNDHYLESHPQANNGEY